MINILGRELKNLYEQRELTAREIAKIYNCSHGAILDRLKKCDIERLPNGRRSVIIDRDKLEELYLRQRLSSRKIAKLYGCWSTAIDNRVKKYGFPTRNRAQAHIIYPRKSFDGAATDKAYLIGFAMGDLRVRKMYPNSETITIDCGSTKKAQIDLISNLFKRYGRIWISKPNKRGVVQIQCSVDESFAFLLERRNNIDSWILRSKESFFAFLAGFTDAEGCVSFSSKGMAYYSLGNYNKNLLVQIRWSLLRNGIICPKLFESKIKGRICFGKYYHNQNYWQLRTNRKDSLLRLFLFIDPFIKHVDKKKAIKMAKENIYQRNQNHSKKDE